MKEFVLMMITAKTEPITLALKGKSIVNAAIGTIDHEFSKLAGAA